jgi:transcriptional regulator with XRE-family HTH domain
MTLAQYLRSRSDVSIHRLARRSGVPESTIRNLARGAGNARFENAVRLEAATEGAVTVAEVCDPNGEIRREVASDVAALLEEDARRAPESAAA